VKRRQDKENKVSWKWFKKKKKKARPPTPGEEGAKTQGGMKKGGKKIKKKLGGTGLVCFWRARTISWEDYYLAAEEKTRQDKGGILGLGPHVKIPRWTRKGEGRLKKDSRRQPSKAGTGPSLKKGESGKGKRKKIRPSAVQRRIKRSLRRDGPRKETPFPQEPWGDPVVGKTTSRGE